MRIDEILAKVKVVLNTDKFDTNELRAKLEVFSESQLEQVSLMVDSIENIPHDFRTEEFIHKLLIRDDKTFRVGKILIKILVVLGTKLSCHVCLNRPNTDMLRAKLEVLSESQFERVSLMVDSIENIPRDFRTRKFIHKLLTHSDDATLDGDLQKILFRFESYVKQPKKTAVVRYQKAEKNISTLFEKFQLLELWAENQSILKDHSNFEVIVSCLIKINEPKLITQSLINILYILGPYSYLIAQLIEKNLLHEFLQYLDAFPIPNNIDSADFFRVLVQFLLVDQKHNSKSLVTESNVNKVFLALKNVVSAGKPVYIEEYTRVLILFLQCDLFREPFLSALAIRANQIEVLKNIYQGGQILLVQKLATEQNMAAFLAYYRNDFLSTIKITRLENLRDSTNIQRLFDDSRLFCALAPFFLVKKLATEQNMASRLFRALAPFVLVQKLATEQNMAAFLAYYRTDSLSTIKLTRLKNLRDSRNIQRLFGVSRLFRALAPFLTQELLLKIYALRSPRTTANLIDFIRKNGLAGLLKLKFSDESKSYLSRFLACKYPWYAAPGLKILKENDIFTSTNVDLLLDYYACSARPKTIDEDKGPKFAEVLVELSRSKLLESKELVNLIFKHNKPLSLAKALITFSKNDLLGNEKLINLIVNRADPSFFAEGLATLYKSNLCDDKLIELIKKSAFPNYFAKILVKFYQNDLLNEQHIKLVEKSSKPEQVASLLVLCKQQDFYNQTTFEFIEKNCTSPVLLRQWVVLIKNKLDDEKNIALILEMNNSMTPKEIPSEVASLLSKKKCSMTPKEFYSKVASLLLEINNFMDPKRISSRVAFLLSKENNVMTQEIASEVYPLLSKIKKLVTPTEISLEVASLLEVLDHYQLVTPDNFQTIINKKGELIWKIYYWYGWLVWGVADQLDRLGKQHLLTQEIFHSIMKLTEKERVAFCKLLKELRRGFMSHEKYLTQDLLARFIQEPNTYLNFFKQIKAILSVRFFHSKDMMIALNHAEPIQAAHALTIVEGYRNFEGEMQEEIRIHIKESESPLLEVFKKGFLEWPNFLSKEHFDIINSSLHPHTLFVALKCLSKTIILNPIVVTELISIITGTQVDTQLLRVFSMRELFSLDNLKSYFTLDYMRRGGVALILTLDKVFPKQESSQRIFDFMIENFGSYIEEIVKGLENANLLNQHNLEQLLEKTSGFLWTNEAYYPIWGPILSKGILSQAILNQLVELAQQKKSNSLELFRQYVNKEITHYQISSKVNKELESNLIDLIDAGDEKDLRFLNDLLGIFETQPDRLAKIWVEIKSLASFSEKIEVKLKDLFCTSEVKFNVEMLPGLRERLSARRWISNIFERSEYMVNSSVFFQRRNASNQTEGAPSFDSMGKLGMK
ncbi:hypothetical protein [Rickettsiella endosymbiont of Aleochara curtula]|uniref:hypothetical protein n=1 Tax=Rickettsiella endosymbiont of Aleochara curtula TaxID=3077936 RepID=UPI00313C43F7